MALYQTDFATLKKPMLTSDGGETVCVRGQYTLPANFALNDVIEMFPLVPEHVPYDFMLDADKIDTNAAPTVALSVGILNAAKTAIDTSASSGGGVWLSASTVGQQGGMARPTAQYMARVTPDPTNQRSIGVLVATGAATPASGVVGLTMLFREMNWKA